MSSLMSRLTLRTIVTSIRGYSKFTHVNEDGSANMVDVGSKDITSRSAVATGIINFSNNKVTGLIKDNLIKKGDVLAVSRVAGIMAAKQTHNLIPLCHSLNLTKVNIGFEFLSENQLAAECLVTCRGQTGVEMEAMVGVSMALNTIYDMCKAVDRHMTLTDIQVNEKNGGKHDFKLQTSL